MSEILLEYYVWIKALHIIAVISWMAGMLYLPRLFVYHAGAQTGSELSETFKTMERRLLRIIMNPALIATWIFGLAMLTADPLLLKSGWFHAKLTAIVLLTGMHMMFSRWRKDFEKDSNRKSAKFFRIVNEVPTLLMIAIVLLAVVKPF